jgi:enoyl-CoA hydratase/carnithine racemase
MGKFETFDYTVDSDHVGTITLDRPDALNSFNPTMVAEFGKLWDQVRLEDDVHVLVLQANGDRAFCTGVDVKQWRENSENPWYQDDPGVHLSPKQNRVWKPFICAVHGMAAGGAFYWLNEADLIVASEDATFFDPHVSYGMTAALEPIGLSRLVPLQEAIRIALMGIDERVSAATAQRIGLVTEVVDSDELRAKAHELATRIAAKPPAAVQGTVRAIWESLDVGRKTALERGLAYTQLGNPIGMAEVDRENFVRPTSVIR